MNTLRIPGLLTLVTVGVAVASAELAAPTANAQPAPGLAPQGSASANPVAPISAPGLTLAELAKELPDGRLSAVPTAKEWQTARRVTLSRSSAAAEKCTAVHVREWLRVRCPFTTSAISVLGGSGHGVSFWIGPEAEGRFGEVQLSVQRGDRRVIQLWQPRKNDAAAFDPLFVLQVHWLEGAAHPTLTLLGGPS